MPTLASPTEAADPLVLGIDLGTTNIKALLVDGHGAAVSQGSAPVSIRYTEDGGAEQDIEEIWQATRTAIGEAVRGRHPARVRAIGISSQGGAIQILDSSDRAVGPIVGWQDARGKPWDRELTSRMGREWLIQRTGASHSAGAVGQVLRLRDAGVFTSRSRLAFAGDIVVGRLCGRRAHDATSLSEPSLLNPSSGDADDELLEVLGLDRSRLPALLAADTAAGALLPDVAGSLGLAAGIPVGPAVHDQYAAALGSGTVRAGDTMLGSGTAWVLVAVTDHLAPPIGGAALVGRHPVPGLYGQMMSMENGGSSISWATRTMGLGSPGVQEVDRILLSVPDGCAGLRFRPLLQQIASLPPGMTARIDGLRLEHTAAHIVRAVVEGLACELGRFLAMMRDAGVRVERLVLCGKAASSSVTPQIISDTIGLPVDCVSATETSALGAAVLGRALLEPGAGLQKLADALRPSLARVQPGPGSLSARGRLDAYLNDFR